MELRIRNVVATVQLDCTIDLVKLATHVRNAEFNPKRFVAVIMKLGEPKSTALVFGNGKMIVTGAKSTNLSRLAAMKHAKIIQKIGFPVKFTNFQIQNVVGNCFLNFPIRLELFTGSYPDASNYEPEIFPAAFYNMKIPKVKVLVFVSGNIVVTGGKSEQDIRDAIDNIKPILEEFRKTGDGDDDTEMLREKEDEYVEQLDDVEYQLE